MRLDVFLKISRLIAKRTSAKAAADAGHVLVNGTAAKSSHSVRVDDIVRIERPESITTVRILEIPATKQVAKKNARELYELQAHKSKDIFSGS